jgi:hypothetical protein
MHAQYNRSLLHKYRSSLSELCLASLSFFAAVNLQTIFHTQCVGTLMMYICTKFQMPVQLIHSSMSTKEGLNKNFEWPITLLLNIPLLYIIQRPESKWC